MHPLIQGTLIGLTIGLLASCANTGPTHDITGDPCYNARSLAGEVLSDSQVMSKAALAQKMGLTADCPTGPMEQECEDENTGMRLILDWAYQIPYVSDEEFPTVYQHFVNFVGRQCVRALREYRSKQ